MVVAAALLSFSVGLLLGIVLFRRASRRIGPTWEEWRHAEQIGGRWKSLIRAAAGAATVVGLYGFGAPPPLRAALLGGVLGTCVPFLLEGGRRYLRARGAPSGAA
jgi:hypothetical protein